MEMSSSPRIAPQSDSVPKNFIAGIVAWCVQRPWLSVLLTISVVAVALVFDVQHFAMTTDTDALLSPSLAFKRAEAQFEAQFPAATSDIVVVIDGSTPEVAETAANRLAVALKATPSLFRSVSQPENNAFFRQNGLLYLSVPDVTDVTQQMIAAEPFLGPVAADPSLRGVLQSLATVAQGVSKGATKLAQIDAPVRALDGAINAAIKGQNSYVNWRSLIAKKPSKRGELRRIILVDPSVDYAQLSPGAAATDKIRETARALGLDSEHGVRVRLTGPVPIADEEFATLGQHMGLIATIMGCAIVLMLWFATKSGRAILCILLSTLSGLVLAGALGLLLFGTFNVISVAFIPLFVGLGVDFGIQFTVRFRSEQRTAPSASQALVDAGAGIGRSLVLAANRRVRWLPGLPADELSRRLATRRDRRRRAASCPRLESHIPPALLRLMVPGGYVQEAGSRALTHIDGFVLGRRRVVLGMAAIVALACLALMPLVSFDFNPMHLRSVETESISTLLDLTRDPDETPNTINIVAPSLTAAEDLTRRLDALPEVSHTVTLANFVPAHQNDKLALIEDASFLLDPTLNPLAPNPAPTDEEIVASLRSTAANLADAATLESGQPAADAWRLAATLRQLANGAQPQRALAEANLLPGLRADIEQSRNMLRAQTITRQALPPELVRQWLAADGHARITVFPNGDSNDNRVLQRFAAAVQRIAPNAAGTPITIQGSASVVVGAFVTAGVLSFLAITVLLFIALRRPRDVIITMTPIVLTGLLTLGSCVIIGQPLNFANIIGLPLLFGIGVAFHIYFVMAWRGGAPHLLQSSLARAVFFSALTTATGFGSLWLSSHPGTSSMGKILMISLVWTLVSALLFQPALMGPPRENAAAP